MVITVTRIPSQQDDLRLLYQCFAEWLSVFTQAEIFNVFWYTANLYVSKNMPPAHDKPPLILPTPVYPAPEDPELWNLATVTTGHHISHFFLRWIFFFENSAIFCFLSFSFFFFLSAYQFSFLCLKQDALLSVLYLSHSHANVPLLCAFLHACWQWAHCLEPNSPSVSHSSLNREAHHATVWLVQPKPSHYGVSHGNRVVCPSLIKETHGFRLRGRHKIKSKGYQSRMLI